MCLSSGFYLVISGALSGRLCSTCVSRRVAAGVNVKQEHDEPMDTSAPPPSATSVPNGSLNGFADSADHANGNAPSQELLDFVSNTFSKHFVLTLNELKRLFNLHLASMPTGWKVFHMVSDHMLQDAVLLCHCKPILVPVSIQARDWQGCRMLPLFPLDSFPAPGLCRG